MGRRGAVWARNDTFCSEPVCKAWLRGYINGVGVGVEVRAMADPAKELVRVWVWARSVCVLH